VSSLAMPKGGTLFLSHPQEVIKAADLSGPAILLGKKDNRDPIFILVLFKKRSRRFLSLVSICTIVLNKIRINNAYKQKKQDDANQKDCENG
jgi:hypothetical protein